MMTLLWKKWLACLKMCLNCGSFFCLPGGLCPVCENRLKQTDFFGLQISLERELKTYFLFEWNPNESDALSFLIQNLKGDAEEEAWDHWARIFLRERMPTLPPRRLIFVPAPASSSARVHAALFAKALARQTGGLVQDLLTKSTAGPQRGRSRAQRSRVRVRRSVNFAKKQEEALYILVDDVLTTGATAYSCYLALAKPGNFEIWVLAKRSLSCGASTDLL